MIPWKLVDATLVPDSSHELTLHKRGNEFSIRIGGDELMNSRVHGSEEALAELACARLGEIAEPRVLVGGLGMGFTLSAALASLNGVSRVVVAELIPAVVSWNRGPLASFAGNPLADERVVVREVDVALVLKAEKRAFNAILLDVDNGPEGLTHTDNDWLYSDDGLQAASQALRAGGVLAIWSASREDSFLKRLHRVGFQVEEKTVRARGGKGGSPHTIWLATKSS
ncbi:MAG: hypothetical protein ABFS09_10705 [Thermodesulfobacteriota bacterium]